ncbi:MAG: nucleotidyltransferase family protein [Thermodesulfobacteriota bacterium]
MTDIEQQLLAVASLLHPDAQHFKQLQRLLPRVPDMDAFIALATQEGLAGLLYKNLLKSGLLETLGSAQKQKLVSHYHLTLRLNLIRIHDLKEVLNQLASTDIRVVLLKGIALLHELYIDVGLRPMGDIDLWVVPEHFNELTGILTRCNFEQDPFYPTTFRKGITTLDLKTHLLGADRIKSRTLLLQKGQEHIFRNARTLSVDGNKVLCLDPYDQVLYLGLHAFKHNMDKLIWLVDIHGLTRGWTSSDWQALAARAKEMGQERTLCRVLFLLRQILGSQFPTAATRKETGWELTVLEKTILNLRKKKGALPEWAPLIFFSGNNDLKHQVIYIFETLFPRPEILRQGFKDFPRLKVWQLYIMRFFQLAGRAFTSFIK